MNLVPRFALAAAIPVAFLPSAFALAPSALPKRTLAHFESEAELKDWLDNLKKKLEEQRRDLQKKSDVAAGAPAMIAPASPMAQSAPAARAAEPAGAAQESVTNVQTAGVDEGGIVKVHGDYLVVLRRGRLFTIGLGNGQGLLPVSMANAFGPGIDPKGAWYDEMLIHGDTIIVIGFSYQRGGTEVGLFDIDRAGNLSYRATYHLRSNDYYSSRNYASRLVGDKLVFYSPLYLNFYGNPYANFPAMRRWSGDAKAQFERIAPATRIYRTDDPVEPWGITMHTVTVCDLAKRDMDCAATAVLGPPGRVFYASQESVYVWTSDWRRTREGAGAIASSVFRIPLDGSAPTGLKTAGSPIDQLSFLESADGYLNVLLRAQGRGEAMWAAEKGANAMSMALMRVPLAMFGDGKDSAPASAYRVVPAAQGYTIQNRFVGDYLLYGSGASWGAPNKPGRNALHALRWAGDGPVQSISIPHGVDRIEAMGRNAIVIGTAGKDLHFSSVRLGDDMASVPYRFTRPNAAQGETRTHGFFYKADGEESGIVGLPVVSGGRPGYKQLREGSAAVTFLRNDALALTDLGDLTARPLASSDDKCMASCVDWYGNARPLFLRNRIFALMGYEIVEGKVNAGGIEEVRRADFSPKPELVGAR